MAQNFHKEYEIVNRQLYFKYAFIAGVILNSLGVALIFLTRRTIRLINHKTIYFFEYHPAAIFLFLVGLIILIIAGCVWIYYEWTLYKHF